MSNLKKDIEKILKDFVLWRTKIIDGKPVATYDKNMLSEWENKNMLSEWEREQYQPMEAVTQIINLIESIIPEPDKHTWRAYGQPDGTVVCDHCNLAEDVNNLLSSQVADIKSKLIDGSKNNGK